MPDDNGPAPRAAILPFGTAILRLRLGSSRPGPLEGSREVVRRLPEVTLKTQLVRENLRALR
jgi:hypothetical protein